jgi:bifunctional DNA-binding transcriptional regulator/antitoxin component of YhaV-PrlF toxin-antitoxin module
MAEKVTIPAELREKLAAANGDAVPLCDEAGNVVGYYLTAAQLEKLDGERRARAALWTDEEIARLEEELAKDPRPDVPHEEVMRWFKEQ